MVAILPENAMLTALALLVLSSMGNLQVNVVQ
jgi:hypothetical protein